MTWRMIKIDDNIPTITITVEEYMHLRECEAECNINNPVDKSEVLDKIIAEIKEWYWQADKQALAQDPCVVDAMIDLFIRTIDKYKVKSEE